MKSSGWLALKKGSTSLSMLSKAATMEDGVAWLREAATLKGTGWPTLEKGCLGKVDPYPDFHPLLILCPALIELSHKHYEP